MKLRKKCITFELLYKENEKEFFVEINDRIQQNFAIVLRFVKTD